MRIKTALGGDSSFNVVFSLQAEKDVNCLEPWLIKEMDSCLSDIWLNKDVDSFAQVFHLILTENVSGKFFILLHEKKPQNPALKMAFISVATLSPISNVIF